MTPASVLRELDTSEQTTAELLLPVFQTTTVHNHRLQPVPDAEMFHSSIQPRTTSERRVIAAFDGSGTPAAYALVTRSRQSNTTLAGLDLRVLPERRGRGHGSALLDAAQQLARTMGCDRLIADLPLVPGESDFAEKRGGTLIYQHQRTVLDMQKIDVDRYRAFATPTGPGGPAPENAQYTSVRWTDHCPDELVQAHIVCREAMHDEPTGGLVKEKNRMTPAQLRELEDARIAYGQRRHTVAVLASNGDMAAFTQVAVVVNSAVPLAPMGNTAVVKAHRGHGLALRIKAELGLWMLEQEPHIEFIDCWNNVENKAMTHINQVLGWEVTGLSSAYAFEL
ncbi:GNAT family N-acetyltransferase [Micromonospora aurantiaca (nom. illeg.)]|uniref:GNAT family N-acetyltransferase n=1 Tax=Micromonospora aurantiaca (nom. illeg.) TaxID=47850 RepID=UPI0014775DCB|nr:GNAT family N-acetyltransferase [Micromonospora aurantiaca]